MPSLIEKQEKIQALANQKKALQMKSRDQEMQLREVQIQFVKIQSLVEEQEAQYLQEKKMSQRY